MLEQHYPTSTYVLKFHLLVTSITSYILWSLYIIIQFILLVKSFEESTIEDLLFQLQEIEIQIFYKDQETHVAAKDGHHLDSSPKDPKFRVGDLVV